MEIADRLAIAPKTASAHLEHILAKLGVSRRAEIAAWAATVVRPEPRAEAAGATGAVAVVAGDLPAARSATAAPSRAPPTVSSDLDRELVDLRGRVAGPLVDPHDRLARRPGREAEDLARLRVEPRPLEMDALVLLDREVALVRLLELLPR